MKTNQTRINRISILFSTTALLLFPLISSAQLKVLSGGNVGVGTTTPSQLLHVEKNQNAASRIYIYNSSTGSSAYSIFQASGSTGNLYLGNTRAAVLGNSAGTEVGYLQSSVVPLFIGTSSSNELRLVTNSIERVRVDASGSVGIGMAPSAGYKLTINGSGLASGGSWVSDQQFKTNIDTLHNALATIKQLKPKAYYFDTANVYGLNFSNKKNYGFIAQDLEQILPELVSSATKNADVDTLGNVVHPAVTFKAVNYLELIAILTKGIQELINEKDSLQSKANNQDSTIASLQNQVTTNNTLLNNQLDQLLTTINNCCTINEGRLLQSQSNNQSQSSIKQTDVKLTDAQTIVLEQNVPNPFAEQTAINYSLPDNTVKAQMLFYNAQGKLIQSTELSQKGKGTLNVFASDLSSGIYTYTLVVDGKIIESKKMVKQ
ncbi:MAG: tail fiber domain-containing protein [Bacteroidota bacterium]